MIKKLSELKDRLQLVGKKRVAIAFAEDPHTIQAIAEASKDGFITAFMIGDENKITNLINKFSYSPSLFEIIHEPDEIASAKKAVEMVKTGKADVLMKGLVSTSYYLKAILDKEKGILPENNILTHITAMEVPTYHKLLFLLDVAVMPYPDYEQKLKMIDYAIGFTAKLGIAKPKIALLSATEKPTEKLPATMDAGKLVQKINEIYGDKVIIDGPVDIFLATDPESVEIKGVPTPLSGDSDILIFPNIEAGNIFYKAMKKFAGAKIAALLQGTEKPVILTSRSEDTESKYLSILLACLTADKS
jgi:phosphate butyryltransferase